MPLTSDLIESAIVPFEPLRRIYIAYSGGIDSHVLLHLAASVDKLREKITAVYVHHGLQADAEVWARHSAETANDLEVDFILLRVNAFAEKGESPEEAARNARYAALKELIGVNDILLVAQHLEDQLETVMLQLLRGGGLRGLSGMPESMAFGQGFMLRPLLNMTKQAILDYAVDQQLKWVEDPSNRCNDYDRNFLRNDVIPLIKQRWPVCAITVARAARHCAEAEVLVSELADEVFKQVYHLPDDTLSISRLRTFNSARQQLAIRHWFLIKSLKMPSHAFVLSLLNQIAGADKNSQPVLFSQGYQIRRYRDKLYFLKATAPETQQDIVWPPELSTVSIGNSLTLSWSVSSAGISLEQWRQSSIVIRFRQGGEKISLSGRTGHHSLKNLFQETGLPPWERQWIPLIYLDNELAAIGDKWISAEFLEQKTDACIKLSIQQVE